VQDFVRRLMSFGAVYWCPVHPLPRGASAQWLAGDGQAAHAAHLRGVTEYGRDVRICLYEGPVKFRPPVCLGCVQDKCHCLPFFQRPCVFLPMSCCRSCSSATIALILFFCA
jgi:hypothetical protein